MRCNQRHTPWPPLTGKRLDSFEDEPDDQGNEEQQQHNIDKAENNAHELAQISHLFRNADRSLLLQHRCQAG